MTPGKTSALICGVWTGALAHVAQGLGLGTASHSTPHLLGSFVLAAAALVPFWYLVLGRESVVLPVAGRIDAADTRRVTNTGFRIVLFTLAAFSTVMAWILLQRALTGLH